MDRRACDFSRDGPSDFAAAGGTDEIGVHEAGGESVGVTADDGEAFAF